MANVILQGKLSAFECPENVQLVEWKRPQSSCTEGTQQSSQVPPLPATLVPPLETDTDPEHSPDRSAGSSQSCTTDQSEPFHS